MSKMQYDYEGGVQRKDKGIWIAVAAILVVLLVIVAGIFLKGYMRAKEESAQRIAELEAEIARLSDQAALYVEVTKEVDISVINSEIKEIGELATLEYLYTDAGRFSDVKKMFGLDVPFTTKSFVVKWDGVIKAGVNVQNITAAINKMKKEIVISIPRAEILSHVIDDRSFEIYDEKDGLFNKVEIKDIKTFEITSKDEMERRAIENGILDKALENAKDIIYKLVNTDVVKDKGYQIVFEIVENIE